MAWPCFAVPPVRMSTESISFAPDARPEKQTAPHPLAPLAGPEIKAAARLIRSVWPNDTDVHFKTITLQEPPKAEVVPFLEAEHSGEPTPSITRKAFVNYYIRNTVRSRALQPVEIQGTEFSAPE